MIIKNFSITIVVALMAISAKAQSPAIIKEQWSDQPRLHNIDASYSKESAVVILDKRRMEYIDEGKEVAQYRTLHKIVRLNDDAGIEAYNTVYLGVSDNNDITDIRARTILPNGKVVEIDKNNIKDRKEEDGNMYKIFALEGLEKGCEIEYCYTFKRSTSFFGKEIIQGKSPVLSSNLEIVCPSRLKFDIKAYNTSVEPVDTIQNEKRIIAVTKANLSGIEEEKYAAYQANLMRIEFKLSYNTSQGTTRLFTWNELAKRAYQAFSERGEKETAAAQKLVSANHWDKLGTSKEKIIAVENYLKKNFTTREDIRSEDAEQIDKIVKSRIASHRGMTRLFGAIYEQLNIDHQLVLAADRQEVLIDRGFENWNNADNFLLYFPETHKFLAPTELDTRYPWIDPYWGAANGLYCKSTKIGNLSTAIGEIRQIPLEDYSQSFSNVESSIKLNAGLDTALIDISQLHAGYPAVSMKAVFSMASPENITAYKKELIRAVTNSENVVSSDVQNANMDDLAENKPFVLHAVVKSGSLVEQAGNKLLFKIGEIIGPQTEMYQEKKRQFPVSLAYPHVLERHIDFVIPKGYTIKNPGDLVFNVSWPKDGALQFGFVSSYSQEGDTLKVHILEEYRNVSFPLNAFDPFQKVINASADFNKVVLVLEKKN